MNQTAVIILSVMAASNLTALAFICWFKARKQRAYFWFGALLGSSALAIISNLLIYQGLELNWLYHLSMMANLSSGAYLVGIVRHLTSPNPVGKLMNGWYFTPSLIYLAFLTTSLFPPAWSENTLPLAKAGQMTDAAAFFNYSICLYSIGANLVLLINAYRQSRQEKNRSFCHKEAKQLLWPMLVLQLGAFIPFMAKMDIAFIITYMPVFGQLFFLYLFFRLANPQLGLLRTPGQIPSEGATPDNCPENKQPKYANLRLTEKRITEIAEAIDSYINSEKSYLHLNLTLHDLSGQLNIPANILSMVINTRWNLRFTDYINKFRVAHAKEALCSEARQRKTIEAIAMDSGFSNRTSFYQAFKKETGLLPNEYAKKNGPL